MQIKELAKVAKKKKKKRVIEMKNRGGSHEWKLRKEDIAHHWAQNFSFERVIISRDLLINTMFIDHNILFFTFK